MVVTADPPVTPAAAYGGGAFDWTPDGNGFVYASTDGGLYLVDARGGPPRRLVEHGPVAAPAVSPDGTRGLRGRRPRRRVASVAADGPWPQRVSTGADFCFDPVWSPDSTHVAWHEWDVPHMPWDESRIMVRAADGRGDPVTVAGGAGVSVQQPRFSPDGSQLAFLCDADGWLNLWRADGDGTGAFVKESAGARWRCVGAGASAIERVTMTPIFSMPVGKSVEGATTRTRAPSALSSMMLERATRECRMSPQIATISFDSGPLARRMVSASSSACVGCSWAPSPALTTEQPTFCQPAQHPQLVADDQYVGAHGVQRHRRVDQRLALLHNSPPTCS